MVTLSKRSAVWAILAVAAFVAAGVFLMGRGPRQHDASSEDFAPSTTLRNGSVIVVPDGSPLRNRLKVSPVLEQLLQTPLSEPAVVEADPARLVKILPPLPGHIVTLNVRLGDTVKAGQPLFSINSADLAQARADYQRSVVQLAQARKSLDRERDLGEHGIAAQREVEQAQSEYAIAETESRRTRARLEQLGVAPDSTTSPSVLTVKSPISGKVTDLSAAPGRLLERQHGTADDHRRPFQRVADCQRAGKGSAIRRCGRAISATLPAYPGETYVGRVQFVADVLDPDTRTVKVRIALDNSHRRFKPGMFANVTFLGKPFEGIAVPNDALVQKGDRTIVFVEIAPWQFEPRPIQIGQRIGDLTVVTSGLKSGERIIVKDGVLLND